MSEVVKDVKWVTHVDRTVNPQKIKRGVRSEGGLGDGVPLTYSL